MRFPPEAYIIGAQRAGTTTLAFLLDQHPMIVLSVPKEPQFYTVNWERGLEWYRSRFAVTNETLLLDASTSYTMAPTDPTEATAASAPRWGCSAPARIHDVRPDAKFIYVLRDPVERIYSAYWRRVSTGAERRPFRRAIAERPVYLATSKYFSQISLYLDHFDLHDFLFIDFRDLTRDPVSVAQTCLRFLAIEPAGFPFELDRPKNRAFRYNPLGLAVQAALGSERRIKTLAAAVTRLAPPPTHRLLKKIISKEIPAISDEDRAFLGELFKSENEKLNKLVGIEFD